jgi:ankyrin repeat protein
LEYGADPNLKDVHGNSALYEATKNNNDDVVEIVLKHGGELALSRSLSASALCNAVYEGDIKCLERLLKANVEINATDYDKRTATHIAASEGNLAALKLLVNAGADLSLKDRWGNTARCEAERVQNGSVLVFLDTLNQGIDYS